MTGIPEFRDHILAAGVLDPEGVHHEFVTGMHGQKLDFDTIKTGSELYEEWIGIAAGFIEEQFPRLPEVILGVARGTNRVALDTARRFEGQVFGAVSEKESPESKVLLLSAAAGKLITGMKPELVVVIEDVGTTGSNSVQVAQLARDAGARNVEVVTTWQRRPQLEKLIAAEVPYRSIIHEDLPTFSKDECEASEFCFKGWKFIPRS